MSTSRVAHGAMWNLIGRLAPVPVALVATPWLIAALGESRWGLFTLALGLVGAFGLFDAGLGRALTRVVAERLGAGEGADSLVLTGLVTLTLLGVLGGGVLAAGAGVWLQHCVQMPPALEHEATLAMMALCAAAPLVVLNAALWGVIAAHQQFRAANLVNLVVAIAYYAAPLAALRICDSLAAVMLALVACRLTVTLCYLRLCLTLMPGLPRARLVWSELSAVARTGGWMTVSAVSLPLLQSADRFLIAALLSAAASGYYAAPFDLITRLSIIPVAVMQTAFPAIAAAHRRDPAAAAAVFRHGVLGIFAALLPPCALAVAYSAPLLAWWLGPAFAAHAAAVLPWLAVGVLLTAIDGMAAGLLDAVGRADVNAKLSIAEMLLYLPLLTGLLCVFGIEGAAMAWAGRCAADLLLRFWLARRLFPPAGAAIVQVLPVAAAAPALLALPLLAAGPPRAALLLAASLLGAGLAWHRALEAEERQRLLLHASLSWRLVAGR